MFDDNTCIAFCLSFFAKQMSICVYFLFYSFFLCCTDVKLWYINKIKSRLNFETRNRPV